MLFLLPALDQGIPGVREGIELSLAWCFGANELDEPMYVDDPFRAYRSIQRSDRYPRAGRYLRAVRGITTGRPAVPAQGNGVHINTECRSYHPGWILFAWSARRDLLAELGPSSAPAANHPRSLSAV